MRPVVPAVQGHGFATRAELIIGRTSPALCRRDHVVDLDGLQQDSPRAKMFLNATSKKVGQVVLEVRNLSVSRLSRELSTILLDGAVVRDGMR